MDLRPQVVPAADLAAEVEVKLLVPVPELLVKVTMEEMEPTQLVMAEVAEVALAPQVVLAVQQVGSGRQGAWGGDAPGEDHPAAAGGQLREQAEQEFQECKYA